MGGVLISMLEEDLMMRRDCDVTNMPGEGSVVLGETSAGADVCTMYIKILEDDNCCRINEPNQTTSATMV